MSKGVLTPDNEDFGFTKVCVSKRSTELAYDLWCDSLGTERDKDVQPFIMLCRVVDDNEEWLIISIDKCSQVLSGKRDYFKELDVVLEYVELHADILLRHWFGEIDDLELCVGLSKKM